MQENITQLIAFHKTCISIGSHMNVAVKVYFLHVPGSVRSQFILTHLAMHLVDVKP